MSQTNSEADEYHFIGNIVRKQTKYGSTVSTTLKEPRYIEHKLQPSDTLQGLALKYNVSMERIKRANNLWTSDSLFSRTSLNIPIDVSIVPNHSSSSSLSSPSSLLSNTVSTGTANGSNHHHYGSRDGMSEIRCEDVFLEDVSETPTQSTSNSTSPSTSSSTSPTGLKSSDAGDSVLSKSNNNIKSKKKVNNLKDNDCDASQRRPSSSNGYNGHGRSSSTTSSTDDVKEESIADFLIRIDSYIAKSKNQVNTIMQQSKSKLTNTYSDDDLFKTSLGYQSSSSSSYLMRQSSIRNGIVSYSGLRAAANESSNDVPQPLVMNQKVKSSLKRLEQQQDEMFEL